MFLFILVDGFYYIVDLVRWFTGLIQNFRMQN